ncbi:MAG: alpha/beta fold hydrolase [Minisyncoccia bacterium]
MRAAHVVEIVTPKKFVLNGLWFGPKKASRAIVIVHGMFSSAFSLRGVVDALVDSQTAVLTFNNRGHDAVTEVKQNVGTKRKYHRAGTTHELFTDGADDIQGAINIARKAGVKEIYLAGHSTGCQKSVYWAHKNKGNGIKGIILLAPLSDYACEKATDKNGRMKKAVQLAKKVIKAKKPHEFMPLWASPSMLLDAQRYLSLYTPDSVEEIFSYSQLNKKPKIYQSVKLPILALFADKDEYAERPAEKMVEWFARNTGSKYFRAGIVPKVGHSFRGAEKRVAQLIKQWIFR